MDKKTRLVLKTTKGYFNIIFLNFDKNKVIGWYCDDWAKLLNIDSLEVHFNYPNDGNLHFTYIHKQDIIEEYFYVYWDKVRIKTVYKNGQPTIAGEFNRNDFKDNILTNLMPCSKAPLLDLVENFNLSGTSFKITDGVLPFNLPEKYMILEKNISDNDLLIDISEMDDTVIHIQTSISNRIKTEETSLIGNSFIREKSLPVKENLYLNISCLFVPNNKL